MAKAIRAFQIFYDERTRAALDRDFAPLDNSENARPDWFEYWPIRNFLAQHRLDETGYYGFLSPAFFMKTQLTGRRVKDFIEQCGDADVITFSPLPCHAACFLNVFEQGEYSSPGLVDAASRFFRGIDPKVDLGTLVTDSRNSVFSNYFFARARFWDRWRAVFEKLFEQAEAPSAPLFALLARRFDYVRDDGVAKPAQMKVFVMERAVSFLLAASKAFTVKNFPPFEIPVASYFSGLLEEIVELDALKIAYAETGDRHFLRRYRQAQEKTLAAVQRRIAGQP